MIRTHPKTRLGGRATPKHREGGSLALDLPRHSFEIFLEGDPPRSRLQVLG